MDITKLEAARRQLDTAVNLYFSEADPVSIHTLAAAAHEVLTHISRRVEGGTAMVVDLMLTHVRPEFVDTFRQELRKAQNFFKHADRDHDAVLTGFHIRQTEILLLDACFAYRRIADENPPVFHLFYVWARITFGRTWLALNADGTPFARDIDPDQLARFASMSRADFFAEMLPIAHLASFRGKG